MRLICGAPPEGAGGASDRTHDSASGADGTKACQDWITRRASAQGHWFTKLIQIQATQGALWFDFLYTFRAQDAAAGKVTFKAVATVLGGRDARLADNAAVAAPTEVRAVA